MLGAVTEVHRPPRLQFTVALLFVASHLLGIAQCSRTRALRSSPSTRFEEEEEAQSQLDGAFERIRHESATHKEWTPFPPPMRPTLALEQLSSIDSPALETSYEDMHSDTVPVDADASGGSGGSHGEVLFTITTDSLFYKTRLNWVLETWAKEVAPQNFNVIGDLATNGTIDGLPKTKITATRCPPHDHWKGACCKNAESVIMAHESLKRDNSLKWAYFADDDAYVVTSAVQAALKEQSDAAPGKAMALGLFGCRTPQCDMGLCGGGGYAFSREAVFEMVGDDPVKFLDEVMKNCDKCQMWGDQALSQVLKARKIDQRNLNGIHPWKLSTQAFCEQVEGGARNLLFHYIKSQHQMEMLHEIFSGDMLIKSHNGPCVGYNGRRACASSWNEDDLPFHPDTGAMLTSEKGSRDLCINQGVN